MAPPRTGPRAGFRRPPAYPSWHPARRPPPAHAARRRARGRIARGVRRVCGAGGGGQVARQQRRGGSRGAPALPPARAVPVTRCAATAAASRLRVAAERPRCCHRGGGPGVGSTFEDGAGGGVGGRPAAVAGRRLRPAGWRERQGGRRHPYPHHFFASIG